IAMASLRCFMANDGRIRTFHASSGSLLARSSLMSASVASVFASLRSWSEMLPMRWRPRFERGRGLRRRPRFERLEDRLTPSNVVGTPGNDLIFVESHFTSPLNYTVTVNGNTTGPFSYTFASEIVTVDGLDGADTITIDSTLKVPFQIDGGPGNDVIQGGAGD